MNEPRYCGSGAQKQRLGSIFHVELHLVAFLPPLLLPVSVVNEGEQQGSAG
jgi:hypothetical protein